MKKIFFIIIILSLFTTIVFAESTIPHSDEILTKLQNEFISSLNRWSTLVQKYALRLFLLLASVNFVVRMIMNLIEGSDFQKTISYIIKFLFITGIFYFFLEGGIGYAQGIVNSFLQIAYYGANMSPSGIGIEDIISTGWDLISKTLGNLKLTNIPGSIASLVLGFATYFVLLLIVANYIIEMLSVWFLVYLGYFLLAFGGSEWTREIAIGYIKAVVSSGMRLMVIIFMIGLSIQQINRIKVDIDPAGFDTMIYCFTIALLLLMLITKLPDAISSIVSTAWGHMSGVNMATGIAVAGTTVGIGSTIVKNTVSSGKSFKSGFSDYLNNKQSQSSLSNNQSSTSVPSQAQGGSASNQKQQPSGSGIAYQAGRGTAHIGSKLFSKPSKDMSEKNNDKKEEEEK